LDADVRILEIDAGVAHLFEHRARNFDLFADPGFYLVVNFLARRSIAAAELLHHLPDNVAVHERFVFVDGHVLAAYEPNEYLAELKPRGIIFSGEPFVVRDLAQQRQFVSRFFIGDTGGKRFPLNASARTPAAGKLEQIAHDDLKLAVRRGTTA